MSDSPGITAAPANQWQPVLRKTEYYRDLIRALLSKEFKVRYKSTVLGYAWSVLHPLLLTLVFCVVVKIIMRVQVEDYPLFLIKGLFPWQWLQNSVCASNQFFLGSASLIKKVRFPRFFLVLSGVLNDMIHFVLSLPVILLFMLYYHRYPGIAMLWLVPLLVLIQLLMVLGLSLVVATCNLFFRDLERLTGILTMLWFYVTPVLYPADMIPARLRWTLYVNPAASLAICWRDIFGQGRVQPMYLALGCGWAILAILVGYTVYSRLQWRFAEIV